MVYNGRKMERGLKRTEYGDFFTTDGSGEGFTTEEIWRGFITDGI
jgi:hypothetical protein